VAYSTIYKKLGEAGLDNAAEERNRKVRAARLEREREAEHRARLLAAHSEQVSVNTAINSSGLDSEVIAEQGSDKVKRSGMRTLAPGKWY